MRLIFEILYVRWRVMGLDQMVQALQSEHFLVDQMQVYQVLQGDPKNAFVPAGSNDEIDFALVPRRWPESEEGTKLPEPGFLREVTVMMTVAKMRNLVLGMDHKRAGEQCAGA